MRLCHWLDGFELYTFENELSFRGIIKGIRVEDGVIKFTTDNGQDYFFFARSELADDHLFFEGHRYENGNVPRYAIVVAP